MVSAIKVNLHFLQQKAQEFYSNGLTTTTRSTYTAGQQRYTTFCRKIAVTPTPASEAMLILFASYLAIQNILHTTIKVQCGICMFLQDYMSLIPLCPAHSPPAANSQRNTEEPRVRLPITLHIMGNTSRPYWPSSLAPTPTSWSGLPAAWHSLPSCQSANSPHLPMISMTSHVTCPSTVCLLTTEPTHSNYEYPLNSLRLTRFAKELTSSWVQPAMMCTQSKTYSPILLSGGIKKAHYSSSKMAGT